MDADKRPPARGKPFMQVSMDPLKIGFEHVVSHRCTKLLTFLNVESEVNPREDAGVTDFLERG